MPWWNPFSKKKDEPGAPVDGPELPKELENSPEAKGAMALFYRKWKDPAFLKQMRALAAHMQKEGVDLKDMKAVKAWLEKNKEAIEKGKLNAPPEDGAAQPGVPFVKTGPDIGRNDPCGCGSGKKFKKCCGAK